MCVFEITQSHNKHRMNYTLSSDEYREGFTECNPSQDSPSMTLRILTTLYFKRASRSRHHARITISENLR